MSLFSKDIKIFSGSSGMSFARRMCEYLKVEMGESETIIFPEGNLFVKINENVRGKDVFIVQSIGLKPNVELVELLFWLDAFKRASARMVTAVIPYLGYAKGDKKDEPRVSIRARVCAECIEAAGADRVVTMDLHSPQIQGFFKKPVDHLFATPLFCEYIKKLELDDFIVAAPDTGFAKEARNYAHYLGVSVVFGVKVRNDLEKKAEIVEIVGDVKGKNILIVDDFTITGGTLINLTLTLREKGANKIYVCLSHFLATGKNIKELNEDQTEMIITTDTVENEQVKNMDKIKIISAAPLFAEAIHRISKNESVSSLFGLPPKKGVGTICPIHYIMNLCKPKIGI